MSIISQLIIYIDQINAAKDYVHSKSSEIILCRSKVDFALNWRTRPQKNGSMKLFLINQFWFGSSLWLKFTHQKRHELD